MMLDSQNKMKGKEDTIVVNLLERVTQREGKITEQEKREVERMFRAFVDFGRAFFHCGFLLYHTLINDSLLWLQNKTKKQTSEQWHVSKNSIACSSYFSVF